MGIEVCKLPVLTPLYAKMHTDQQWVCQAVLQSVRLNSEPAERKRLPRYRELSSETRSDFTHERIDTKLVRPDRNATNTTERVLSVLLNSQIRRGNLGLIQNYVPYLRQRIDRMMNLESPIAIVLPTLPFKDQNPLTTRHSLDQVDLGEYLLFGQLRNICASIEAVYPPGARVTLLTDGLVYADFFAGGQRARVEQYRRNCVQIRDQMSLQKHVTIFDLEWLINQEPSFLEMVNCIGNILATAVEDNSDVRIALNALTRGMLLHLPMPGLTFDEYLEYLSNPYIDLPQTLKDQAQTTAMQYASFMLALRRLQILERGFPNTLRATVHPKNAPQLPLHLVNKHSVVSPYNGVPVVSERKLANTHNIQSATRIIRYYQLLEIPDVKAVYDPEHNEPLYYLHT